MAGTSRRREIAARIRATRKAKNIRSRVLADAMRVSVKLVGEIERGGRNLYFEEAVQIAKALGVSLNYLATGEPDAETE